MVVFCSIVSDVVSSSRKPRSAVAAISSIIFGIRLFRPLQDLVAFFELRGNPFLRRLS